MILRRPGHSFTPRLVLHDISLAFESVLLYGLLLHAVRVFHARVLR